jgi:hypothetical protein
LIDFEFFLTSTLGISSVMGLGPFAGFAVRCDRASVARHGSMPGVLSCVVMADALSAVDDRGQISDCRRSGPIAYFRLL